MSLLVENRARYTMEYKKDNYEKRLSKNCSTNPIMLHPSVLAILFYFACIAYSHYFSIVLKRVFRVPVIRHWF